MKGARFSFRPLFGSATCEGRPSLFAIVEVAHGIPDDLFGFVTLAGDEHDVARACRRDRVGDCPRAIELDHDGRGLRETRKDRLDDRPRVLAPRVVAGDDRHVGPLGHRPPHGEALARVAIASAPEHADDATRARPLPQRGQGRQNALERVRRVRVVDDDEEGLPGFHLLEAAGHGANLGQRRRDGLGRETQGQANSDGAEQVHHVVLADQWGGQREPAGWRRDRHANAVE